MMSRWRRQGSAPTRIIYQVRIASVFLEKRCDLHMEPGDYKERSLLTQKTQHVLSLRWEDSLDSSFSEHDDQLRVALASQTIRCPSFTSKIASTGRPFLITQRPGGVQIARSMLEYCD